MGMKLSCTSRSIRRKKPAAAELHSPSSAGRPNSIPTNSITGAIQTLRKFSYRRISYRKKTHQTYFNPHIVQNVAAIRGVQGWFSHPYDGQVVLTVLHRSGSPRSSTSHEWRFISMAAISTLKIAWLMGNSGYLPLIIYLGIFTSSSVE